VFKLMSIDAVASTVMPADAMPWNVPEVNPFVIVIVLFVIAELNVPVGAVVV
jgi:hypothetical protein